MDVICERSTRILFGISLPILLLAPFTLWLRFPSMRRYFEEEEAEVKKSESAETAAAVSGIAAKPGFSQADMANGELGRTRIQPIQRLKSCSKFKFPSIPEDFHQVTNT